MVDGYKPRFIFEITEEQKVRADRLISFHGIRRPLFSIILDDLLDIIEKHGNAAVGLILDKAVKPSDVIPVLSKAKKGLSNG